MLKKLKKKQNNKGFTLVELLVVIAIIGILAVVAVPSLFKQLDKAKATQVVANVKAIQTEVLTEYANSQGFTDTATSVQSLIDSSTDPLIKDENKKFGDKEKYTVIPLIVSDKSISKGGKNTANAVGIKVEIEGQTDIVKNVNDQLSAKQMQDKTRIVVVSK